ncbi:MAG: hypothetical protein KO463_08905 [Candidatus Methanofastidiosa archaeon]|nr:hypothetical protein [Candidatus Methanofastidiosa archaeon]
MSQRVRQYVRRRAAQQSQGYPAGKRSQQIDRLAGRGHASRRRGPSAFCGEQWTLNAPGQSGQCFPKRHA